MAAYNEVEFKMRPEYEQCILAEGYRLQKMNNKIYCMREDQTLEARVMQVKDMAMKPQELIEMKIEMDSNQTNDP